MFCYLYDMNDIFFLHLLSYYSYTYSYTSIVPFVTPTEMLINQQPLVLALCVQDTKWCT